MSYLHATYLSAFDSTSSSAAPAPLPSLRRQPFADPQRLFIAEILKTFIETLADIRGDFMRTFHHGTLREIILVLVFADLERLIPARIGDRGKRHPRR